MGCKVSKSINVKNVKVLVTSTYVITDTIIQVIGKKPFLKLTDFERRLIQKSWNSDIEFFFEISSSIYAYVFAAAPETKQLFAGLNDPTVDWKTSTSFRIHTVKFSQMLDEVVRYLHTPNKVEPLLEAAGRRHKAYKVADEMLQAFRTGLRLTLRGYLTKNQIMFSDDLEDCLRAWDATTAFIISSMQCGLQSCA